jgi:CheY-like chemotaxis protein
VESTKDSGSRFFFTYPLGKTKIKKASEKKEKSTEHASMDWSEKEILIAEDVESNYLYIKELLSPTQVRILRARDGIEALDIFRNHAGIDLVIMDILMPGMDGYEATTEIRNLKPEIPVIAQSAFTFEGDIQDGLYAGCFNDYIMKPYTRKVLLAVINKYFSEE